MLRDEIFTTPREITIEKKKRNLISSRHVPSFLFTYVANLRTTQAIFVQRVLPSELVLSLKSTRLRIDNSRGVFRW